MLKPRQSNPKKGKETIGDRLRHKKAFIPKSDTIDIPFLADGVRATPGGNDGDDGGVATQYRTVSRHLFEDADGILPVHGMSMNPTYFPGQEVALVHDTSNFFEFGQVYALIILGNKIPVLKRIYQCEEPGCVELYSDNTAVYTEGARAGKYIYPPQPLHLDQIVRKFRPIGAQGRDSNKPVILRNPEMA